MTLWYRQSTSRGKRYPFSAAPFPGVTTREILFWMITRVVFVLVLVLCSGLHGEGGSSYADLRPRQQELVKRWSEELQKVLKRPVDAQTAFDRLSISARTTFDAITHALLTTNLTDQKTNKSLGTAMDLVEVVESVNGKIPDARGDHQFRMYVLLKPDALRKLYASKEFDRTGDNTVYHIGYPINFRLKGGDPSIQVSLTRTGKRADIDVDYRSSRGPKALVNGHLTSANSDVRAGSNYFGHVRRWNGLAQWWLSLFERRVPETDSLSNDVARLEAAAAEKKSPDSVDDAVHDFYKTWLADRNALEAVKYFSVRSYACIQEHEQESSVNTPLIRMRMLQRMGEVNREMGDAADLRKVLTPARLDAPNSQTASNKHGGEFHLESLRDDAALGLDCRVRFKTGLAERLEQPEGKYAGDYAATVELKLPDGQRVFLTQVWRKEEGSWKIQSWSLEDPFKHHPEALPRIVPKNEPPPEQGIVKAEVVTATARFLETWLVQRDMAAASKFFARTSQGCLQKAHAGAPAESLNHWLAEIAKEADGGSSLNQKITAVPYGHEGLMGIKHPMAGSYVLAQMSDGLGVMNACPADGTPTRFTEETVSAKPRFTAGYIMTAFALKSAVGQGAVVKMVWAKRGTEWLIISFHTEAD